MIKSNYKFSIPGSDAVVLIHLVEKYMPGQVIKTSVFRLSLPPERSSSLRDDRDYADWADVMRALANAFCDGDLVLAATLIDA